MAIALLKRELGALGHMRTTKPVFFIACVIGILFACCSKQPSARTVGPVKDWQIPESWSVGQGSVDGKIVITRFNLGLRPLVGRPEYPSQLGIAVPFNDRTENGLPTSAESEQLNQIEDEISRRFPVANESLFAGVITTNNMREFVLYTSNDLAATEKARQLVRDISTHKIQFALHHDPSWGNFTQYAAGASN